MAKKITQRTIPPELGPSAARSQAIIDAFQKNNLPYEKIDVQLEQAMLVSVLASDYVYEQLIKQPAPHCWAMEQSWYLENLVTMDNELEVSSPLCLERLHDFLHHYFLLHHAKDATPNFSKAVSVSLLNPLCEADFFHVLRAFRHLLMVRIIIRDHNRLASLLETTAELTVLAQMVLSVTLEYYKKSMAVEYGYPIAASAVADDVVSKDGALIHSFETHSSPEIAPQKPLELIVLGMGKLGAYELNLSSDIDLIFAFESDGNTVGGLQQIDNESYFIRLGRKLINALSTVTADGFVFRVDMRLRPYGQSGALVSSFAAIEKYYEKQGRDWERYAFIKARVVAGDLKAGTRLLKALQPFVFRRYIDFGAIDALREMKAMINREVKRQSFEDNIKIGSGGIREIEFIAQVFQLIRGGQESSLQQQKLFKVYESLKSLGLLPEVVVNELLTAYTFLRNLEHAIQALQDKQTQVLPGDTIQQAKICFAMNIANWHELLQNLELHRNNVRKHFSALIESPSLGTSPQSDNKPAKQLDNIDEEPGTLQDIQLLKKFSQWWQAAKEESAQVIAVPAPLNNHDWHSFLAAIEKFAQSKQLTNLQTIALDRLDKLMPMLQLAVYHLYNKDKSAADSDLLADQHSEHLDKRLLPIVEAILRRSSYMLLLQQHPSALKHLVQLCAASRWLAEELATQSFLLDDLIDARHLFVPPSSDQLKDELRQHLLRIPADDLEWQMEHLRHFKSSHVLRVAAAELQGNMHLMKISDYLTDLAEALLEAVLQLAWQQLVQKHGQPTYSSGQNIGPEFVIIGYGKLGGKEMGYHSDLDLVFIYDAASAGLTDGEHPIDNSVFFARLGQRIIHFLSTQTLSGRLYEVDMRLRPSGASGLLVSSMAAFEKYQREQAWTWEHQALVRARVVAGSPALAQMFHQCRAALLSQPRNEQQLLLDVNTMRSKLRVQSPIQDKSSAEQGGENEECFDLKQGLGGIVDIEFMVQFALLRWASAHPKLTKYTDNIDIINGLEEAGVWPAEHCKTLKRAYLNYRSCHHRNALQGRSAQVRLDAPLRDDSQAVLIVWQEWMGDAAPET